MSDFEQLIRKVIDRWNRENTILLPAQNEAIVKSFLEQTEHNYSNDVVELYCLTGGMDQDYMDNRCFSFWPLEKLVDENLTNRGTDLYFSDFLIHSHYYGFMYENENVSSVWIDYLDGKTRDKIAGSVYDFFELFLNAPGKLQMFD